MDFLLALCPWIIIHKLQMRKREKMNIIAVRRIYLTQNTLTNISVGNELRVSVSVLVARILHNISDSF